MTVNGYKYKTNPFIVYLPKLDKNTGKYLYDLVSYPKFMKEKILSSSSIVVLKIWNDKGFENKRPDFIEVELIENGKVKEILKLNKVNNWRYHLENLNPSSLWSFIEKNIDKNIYTVKIKEDGGTYLITNSYMPSKISSTVPIKYKKRTKIPQTGQLWWPVYLLLVIGSVSILLGFMKEKKKGDRNEE